MTQPRTWRTGLLAVAALGLCLQVGMVRVSRDDGLEAKLAELRRDSRRAEARLSRQLRSARAESRRLRDALVRRAALAAALKSELDRVRADATRLESRAELAVSALGQEPPPLDLSLAPDREGDVLLALAENPGPHEIHIVESDGRLWIGQSEQPLAAGESGLVVGPGEELDFLEFPLLDPGTQEARGVVCAVYERSFDGVSTAWAREIWFEYRPDGAGAAVVEQYRWAPGLGEAACDLSSAGPPWPLQLSAAR